MNSFTWYVRRCGRLCEVTGALRTGSRVSEDILWQTLNQCYEKWRSLKWLFTVVTCSPTFTVYCDIILGNKHKQLSCTKALHQRISVQSTWYAEFTRANFHDSFCTITFYFNWTNFLSVGVVNVAFQSAGTGKYAMPTRHLKFHFVPSAVSYELFPWWNQSPLDFFSIKPSNTLQLSSDEFCMSYFQKKNCQLAIMQLFQEWLAHATVHGARNSSTDALKIVGSAMQNDLQCYRRAIASHLVKWAKDKTVRKSTNLQLSVCTVIAKVLNCIPRFCIVYIVTTTFLLRLPQR